MKNLLDNERLVGPHDVRIIYRPERVALTISTKDESTFIDTAQYICQVWSGANTPLIPVNEDNSIPIPYTNILPGSAVDRVRGLRPHDLYDPIGTKVTDIGSPQSDFGYQLAAALLRYRQQSEHASVQIVELDPSDPWRGIYAACLGLLPTNPDPNILHNNSLQSTLRFEDFFNVEKVATVGSLNDLIERLTSYRMVTPRIMSMVHLAYGSNGSTAIRSSDHILPQDKFAQSDAGPNVVVVCSPGKTEDLTLLWNLRAAYGDRNVLPIGIPLNEANPDAVDRIRNEPSVVPNGIPARDIYVTSSSVSVSQLQEIFGVTADSDELGVASHEEMLTFGPAAGWPRNEVITWLDGVATFVPLPQHSHREILGNRGFGRLTRMVCDIDVLSNSFPHGDDIRVNTPNAEFRAGVKSMHTSASNRSRSVQTAWPSRILIARSVAANRRLDLQESEPGKSARIVLQEFDSLYELENIAHAPLLELLELMAARDGIGWYKNKLRLDGRPDEELPMPDAVAPVADELPEKPFSAFKKVFGNNEKATKYWLLWAEKAKLIVKGFPLQCSNCEAKQWIPVSAFAPPIVCRGCAEEMTTPFQERPIIDFKYRLTERLRRVYKHDAIGHLLVARYFHWLLDGGGDRGLVGLHPGMEVRRHNESAALGEADVLILTHDANFIPVEVKRTANGFVAKEIEKLDALAGALNAEWSALATCQYGVNIASSYESLEMRTERPRFILSYDTLLKSHPVWMMNEDPFAWRPLNPDEIEEREREFVQRLARKSEGSSTTRLEGFMLNRPGPPKGPDGQ